MRLYKGKTKNILDSSIDVVLSAVEAYNKPRTNFRIENHVLLMIIGWTRLFHAFFNRTLGNVFYYKNNKGTRYKYIDGERSAWDLKECLKQFKKSDKGSLLTTSIEANINFFILLRNKIAHRHIPKSDIEPLAFGEFQSLLYNYETFVTLAIPC